MASPVSFITDYGLPPVGKTTILLDFDGTLTATDVLDELVSRFAVDKSWKQIERDWQAGRIGSWECLRKEFALLRVTPSQVQALLREIELDPGAGELLRLLSRWGVPVVILSDGLDSFIKHFLARLPPEDLPKHLTIRANTSLHRGDRIELRTPHHDPACECQAAHCKCRSAQALHQERSRRIYVGDGLSDLCPARKCDHIFAKARLAEALTREHVPFTPFITLGDVARTLAAAWSPALVKAAPRGSCTKY